MFGKLFPVLLVFFTYALATKSHADESYVVKGSIMQVVINQAESIAGLDGDRLYLKQGNIFHSQHGYMLCNGGSSIFLPRLSFDEHGAYLVCRRSPDDFKLKCSRCGYVWWFTDIWSAYCPKCGGIGN